MEILKNREEFAKWADVFRKKGVESIQIGDVILKFSAEALLPESDYKRRQKLKEVEPKEEQISEDSLATLLWSTNAEVKAG